MAYISEVSTQPHSKEKVFVELVQRKQPLP